MKSSLLIVSSTSNPLIIFPKIEYLPSSSGILLVTKKNSVDEDLLLSLYTIAIEPLSKVLTKFSVSEGFFT